MYICSVTCVSHMFPPTTSSLSIPNLVKVMETAEDMLLMIIAALIFCSARAVAYADSVWSEHNHKI